MRHRVLEKPDFSMVEYTFEAPGEQVLGEASAMVARDTGVEMKTSLQGGMLQAMKRAALGGESLFQNTFTATAPGQRLWLAAAPEGDVETLELDGSMPVFLSSGAYLCSAPTVSLDTKWEGGRGFFSGAGLFLLRCGGTGPLHFSSYGAIHAIDVGPAGMICDTGTIVAFTGGLRYTVTRVGGLGGLFLSGEGLVCRFEGSGRLYLSTRNPRSLASFLQPFRPVKVENRS